jgi:hypothetical protein
VGPRTGTNTEVGEKISCLCWGSNLDRPVVQICFKLVHRNDVVTVTSTTGLMFHLSLAYNFWYGEFAKVVHDCRKFAKHWQNQSQEAVKG